MQRKAIPFLLSPLLKFMFPSPLAQMGAPSSAPSPHSAAVPPAWGSQAPLSTTPDTGSTVGTSRMSRTAQSSQGHTVLAPSPPREQISQSKKKKKHQLIITEALRLEKTLESLNPTTPHRTHSLSPCLTCDHQELSDAERRWTLQCQHTQNTEQTAQGMVGSPFSWLPHQAPTQLLSFQEAFYILLVHNSNQRNAKTDKKESRQHVEK